MSGTTFAGAPLTPVEARDRISALSLSILPIDLIVQWRRCSVTADFLGEYLSYLFEDRGAAAAALSAGVNEVIENLAKFSADKREPVSVDIAHYGDLLRITTRNVGRRANALALAARLDRMATEDAEDLFLEQLEHTASQDWAASGLGLITIKKDYGARLGVSLSPVEGAEDLVRVEFHLELDAGALEQG